MASLTKSLLVTAALLATAPAFAQQDAHHPDAAGQAPSAAAPARAQPPQGQPEMPGMTPGYSAGGPMGGMMQMMEMMHRGDMMGAMMSRSWMMPMPAMMGMADHTEGWLAFLRTELRITDAQKPSWDKFAEAVHANAKAMAERPGTMMMTQPGSALASLPARLAAGEEALAAQLEAVHRLKAGAEPLYAVLTDGQRKTFDELTAAPRGMM
jgi:hypothetical protein